MTTLRIHGGIPLQGSVRIQGSKNAALPILSATLLSGDESCIHNCPRIADVQNMVNLLKSLGCRVNRIGDGWEVDSSRICGGSISGEAITGMRSSLCLLGALIGRCREVFMDHPGGCVIGARPIDLHIAALRQMGAVFSEENGRLKGTAAHLHGADISLQFPSVGATENILLAAVQAEGDTVITGAAREPEVVSLCQYLKACGAVIEGIGSERIRIHGGANLHGTEFTVPADRIVAGTYLFACVGTGGNVLLENVPCNQMHSVIRVAEQMGAQCQISRGGAGHADLGWESGLYVQGPDRPNAIPALQTEVYPGFPTDLQSMALTVLTKARGVSRIEETIFENRFRVVEPLRKMGADIRIIDCSGVQIQGVESLRGAEVEARELRGGAALVLAGLMAEGESVISGCGFIERGYENIGKDLRELGARIVSV